MIEYRHNPQWDVMFFPSSDPRDLKRLIEAEVLHKRLGDIEVIDTSMTTVASQGFREHNILVFYRPLVDTPAIHKEVVIKDG